MLAVAPSTLAGIVAAMLLVAGIASLLPALAGHAGRPALALRQDNVCVIRN